MDVFFLYPFFFFFFGIFFPFFFFILFFFFLWEFFYPFIYLFIYLFIVGMTQVPKMPPVRSGKHGVVSFSPHLFLYLELPSSCTDFIPVETFSTLSSP